jgi:hypothetical protein
MVRSLRRKLSLCAPKKVETGTYVATSCFPAFQEHRDTVTTVNCARYFHASSAGFEHRAKYWQPTTPTSQHQHSTTMRAQNIVTMAVLDSPLPETVMLFADMRQVAAQAHHQ